MMKRQSSTNLAFDLCSTTRVKHSIIHERSYNVLHFLLPDYPSEETWLCGNVFTAADINAVILILRLNMVGIEARYCSAKRPAVCEYVKRLKERSSTKKISAMYDSLPSLFRKRILKMVGKRMFQASILLGIAGAGYFIYKKYSK